MKTDDDVTLWADEAHHDRYFAVLDHISAGSTTEAWGHLVLLVADAVKVSPEVDTADLTGMVQQHLVPEVIALAESQARGEQLPSLPTDDWASGVRGIAELLQAHRAQ